VLAGYRGKYRSIGTVIDFGNSNFTPFYMNEGGICKYGGWDLDALDICKEYSISKIEYDTNNLVFNFEGTLFAAMLQLKIGKDPRPHIDRFLKNCRHYMQIN